MKSVSLSVLAAALFSLSSEAATFTCKEIYDIRQEVIRARTTVVVKETADITKTVSDRMGKDFVYKVDVTISTTLRGQTTIEKKFSAIAGSEDVMYEMNSRSQGVRFYVYLDEANQAGVEYTDSKGRAKKISLSCEWEGE